MRKLSFLFLILISTALACAQEPLQDYLFFANSAMTGNYFFSKAVYQAPSYIKNEGQQLPVSETVFFTPGNALVLEYTNGINGNWSATILRPDFRGRDHFKAARYLSFHIYNASANEQGGLPAIQLGNADTILSKKYFLHTENYNRWEQMIIPLDSMDLKFKDPSEINAVVFSQPGSDGKRYKIYIDDIEFLSSAIGAQISSQPVLLETKGYEKHIDLRWKPVADDAVKYIKIYRSGDGKNYQPVGIQTPDLSRYADFTGQTNQSFTYKISFLNNQYSESDLSVPLSSKTRTMSDDDMLSMVQEACFRYYWEGAESYSGLAKENMPGRQNMIAMGASGFGIMALIVGTERKFITREQSIERFLKIVHFLARAETFHGAFPHFMDGPSKKVEPFFGARDNGGDLVETSFLMQGLIAARAYFNKEDKKEKEIRDKITAIWQRVEWNWYKQFPDSKFLYWHWSPDKAWIINHPLIGWNETMVTYLLAIASPTHSVDAGMYYSGWASQEIRGQQYRMNWGGTKEGSMYTNGNSYFGIKLDVGVSDGGPLFFTHYSYLGYDPHLLTDTYTNYFSNNKNIAQINYNYCVKNPRNYKGYGDSCWGLTACIGPYDYSADEPNAARDKGKIAPTGAISSFPYMPEESMKALKNYYNNYGKFLWGEYGFRDAFNLTQNWCSGIYMGLNQATMIVMIENYRSGLIWKLFMSDRDIQNGLKKLNEETKKK